MCMICVHLFLEESGFCEEQDSLCAPSLAHRLPTDIYLSHTSINIKVLRDKYLLLILTAMYVYTNFDFYFALCLFLKTLSFLSACVINEVIYKAKANNPSNPEQPFFKEKMPALGGIQTHNSLLSRHEYSTN